MKALNLLNRMWIMLVKGDIFLLCGLMVYSFKNLKLYLEVFNTLEDFSIHMSVFLFCCVIWAPFGFPVYLIPVCLLIVQTFWELSKLFEVLSINFSFPISQGNFFFLTAHNSKG